MAKVSSERWQQVKQIFQEALESEQSQRGPLLDRQCGDDSELRREVEQLLAHHGQAVDERFLSGGNRTMVMPSGEDESAKRSDSNVLAAERDTMPPAQSGDTSISSKDVVDQVFGRYRLVKLLGQGAMGEVYLAHDTTLDRQVALKIPKFEGANEEELVERFYREAKAAATFTHPNICPVYDVGNIDGKHYIAMAYIDGRTLSDLIRSGKRYSERQVAHSIRKLALAIHEAHRHGIVHRDLKPGNIMINRRGEPIVMDFGLARRLDNVDDRMTQTGSLLGSPSYMSPEQAKGQTDEVGPASDIYSLGVIFYELLTGQLPFQGNLASLLFKIANETPQRPGELRSDISPELEDICLKMMSKRIDNRFDSMQEVAGALREFLKSAAKQTGKSGDSKLSIETTAPPKQSVDKLEQQKQQIESLRDQHQYPAAIALLHKMKSLRGASAAPYVEWAQRELSDVESEQELYQQHCQLPCDEARGALVTYNYLYAIDLLESVPDRFRGKAYRDLMDQAIFMKQEVASLEAAVETRELRRDRDRYEQSLRRLLQLKPDHERAQQLLKRLELRKHFLKYAWKNLKRTAASAPWLVWTAVGAGALLLVALGVITLVVQLGKEQVKIELDESLADAEVYVDGERIRIENLGATIDIRPGKHNLTIKRGDVVVDTRDFRVLRGETPVLRVSVSEPDSTGNNQPNVRVDPSAEDGDASPPASTPGPAPSLAIAPFSAQEASQHQQRWAKYLGAPVESTNSVGMKFVVIPPGEFLMGSTDTDIENESQADEAPQHRVRITEPYILGVYEVTQAQYRDVTGVNPSAFSATGPATGPYSRSKLRVAGQDTSRFPVEMVSWYDAIQFCNQLSKKENLPPYYRLSDIQQRDGSIRSATVSIAGGTGYRLPTEAEWEHACRAGSTTKWYFGDNASELSDHAFYWAREGARTHSVGQKKANPFGLYDLYGNVAEWCQDLYELDYYKASPMADPIGPATGRLRARRNGSWGMPTSTTRSAQRWGEDYPGFRDDGHGFRVARTVALADGDTEIRSPELNDSDGVGVSSDRAVSASKGSVGPKPTLIVKHPEHVEAVAYSPSGNRFATAGQWKAHVWDAVKGELLAGPFELEHAKRGSTLDVSFVETNDAVALLGSSSGGGVLVQAWDLTTNKPLNRTPFTSEKAVVASSFIENGARLAALDSGGALRAGRLWKAVHLLSLKSGNVRSSQIQIATNSFGSPHAFSPDGRYLAGRGGSRFSDGAIYVFNIATGRPYGKPLAHDDKPDFMIFSANSKLLLTATGQTANLWDVTRQKRSRKISVAKEIDGAAFSPEGDRVALAMKSGGVRLYKVSTGEIIGQELPVTVKTSRGMAFAPDGRRLLATARGELSVWDLP